MGSQPQARLFGRGRADEALDVALTYGQRIVLVRGSHDWADHAAEVLRMAGADVLAIRGDGEPELAHLKRFALNLNHISLPEIKDFNALCDGW